MRSESEKLMLEVVEVGVAEGKVDEVGLEVRMVLLKNVLASVELVAVPEERVDGA